MKKLKSVRRIIMTILVLIAFKFFILFYWVPKNKISKIFKDKDKLKVLHIWNVAGVSNTLALEQRKLGVHSDIIARLDLDRFQFYKVHRECFIALPTSFFKFYVQSLFVSRQYDIIHVHWYDWILPYLRFLYRKKRIIIHYHGSDIRYKLEEKRKKFKHADFVAVSTSDLLDHIPEASYIPNPVDLQHFTRKKDFEKNTALTFQSYNRFEKTVDLAEEEAKKRGLLMTIVKREEKIISYPEMPRFLETYEHYIDVRQEPIKDKLLDTLSLTALQSLALGSKVIFQNQILDEFPLEHDPTSVADKWIEIYTTLLHLSN